MAAPENDQTSPTGTPHTGLIDRQISKALDDRGLTGGGGGDVPHLPNMSERLGKLESAVESLRHGQNWTLGAIAILSAFIIGFGVYSLQRMDSISDKVSALPLQISADLRDLTKTLAETITAAKQQPPQVILMPAPPQQTSRPTPKP
jgi:hypothetical protein